MISAGASGSPAKSASGSVPSAEALAEGAKIVGKKLKLDDLKVVEGIGPAIAELLHTGGIKTWRDLQAADVKKLQSILDSGGSKFSVHNPGTWPQQAGLLVEGKWKEFKALTDKLVGGV